MVAESTLIVPHIHLWPNRSFLKMQTGASKGDGRIEPEPSPLTGHGETTNKSKKRIAIVDDEEELCLLFSMLIKKLGYQEECVAHDGDKIVQFIVKDGLRPDLIIMDYRMPTMNGMHAAKKILQLLPKMRIIIASADDSVRNDAADSGMFFIQKPFSMSALANSIESALKA
jgi:DNA-binding NtrC family response regulator